MRLSIFVVASLATLLPSSADDAGDPPCNICGVEGQEITLPDVVLDVPTFGEKTCAELVTLGEGGISAGICAAAPALVAEPCGCAAVDPPCNICGVEGQEITLPDVVLDVPTLGNYSCAELVTLGEGGISAGICAAAPSIVAGPCGCAQPDPPCNVCGAEGFQVVTLPDVEVEIPNVGIFTCAQLFALGQGGISEDLCAAAPGLVSGPCGCEEGDPPCNICGEAGHEITLPDVELDVPGLGPYTCAELVALGEAGISEGLCTAAPALVAGPCGCTAVGPPACNICGVESQSITLPDVELELPGLGQYTCAELVTLAEGGISEGLCAAAPALVAGPCGCAEDGSTPAPADPPCDICGHEDFEISLPDKIVSLPFGLGNYTCGTVDALGKAGVPPELCAVVPVEVAVPCGCVRVTDSASGLSLLMSVMMSLSVILFFAF